MSEFQIKPASRTGVKPLIGMYGKSGSGKTFSALLLMRGLVGPKGRICLVDTESGRGSIFSDIAEIGGYSVIELEPPFSPDRYLEAFESAEAGSDGVIVDSLTHEHNGEGGLLDMHEAEFQRMGGRDNVKMTAWIKPKMSHKKFIGRLLRCKVPLICCLRGEEKTHIEKNGSRTEVFTDKFSSPIFDPRFIFELLVNFETVAIDGKGGYVIPRKITHPGVEPLLPRENQQIGISTGEALARWCAAPGSSQPKPESAAQSLKLVLWALLAPVLGPDIPKAERADRMNRWLWDECCMDPSANLTTTTQTELASIVKLVEKKLKPTT